MQFKDLLILLKSQEGILIGELDIGSPATRFTFDEVAADIRLMMPSSQYKYDSNSGSQLDESHYLTCSAGNRDSEQKRMFSPIRRYFKS
jgi:hypothetical protein